MGLITKEEYIDSLRRQKPNVYIAGEKVESLPDHPAFKTSIDSMAVTYDWAQIVRIVRRIEEMSYQSV